MGTDYLSVERVQAFELLVEELIKNSPNETQVEHLMGKLDLEYIKEPVERIGFVLEKMNQLVYERKKKRDHHDL